ncbi:putative small molecule binding protein (contains 3H domain) [Desulfosporosinus acidiphilus SJ4]|uniref:Putative small molecule binding protein (Contains 3H domain) n=1 Tax=Desulfosporosinus acidiphilus (strain DSM 22704 / JCM 16185 / SJ4) TaxID=646529 RepID=I4D2I4_DESAJ|nr:transcription repressor NadR [Desulfosporosinus acidiphilus]AFM40008.1 putative small molecule binding protein (contains 3H domain) [Desulfosporosinus acidiphilus SJ4]
MSQKEGLSGQERRDHLLKLLKNSKEPIKAAALAKLTGVSRQVIVQDIALLRASEEPVIATPHGYLYSSDFGPKGLQRIIYSRHSPSDTEKELNILVDHGVSVLDVGVEHSVYGNIFRPLQLRSRLDVKKFLVQMSENNAYLLSSLTGGLHLHTIEAPSEEVLKQVYEALKQEGFLVDIKE